MMIAHMAADEGSRRLTLKVQPDLYEAVATAAHAAGMGLAEYVRLALRAQLKLDGCAPSATCGPVAGPGNVL